MAVGLYDRRVYEGSRLMVSDSLPVGAKRPHSKKLRVGVKVDMGPDLGRCVVERIAADPGGGDDFAYVRAEKPTMAYESEPGDPTLYVFRAWWVDKELNE